MSVCLIKTDSQWELDKDVWVNKWITRECLKVTYGQFMIHFYIIFLISKWFNIQTTQIRLSTYFQVDILYLPPGSSHTYLFLAGATVHHQNPKSKNPSLFHVCYITTCWFYEERISTWLNVHVSFNNFVLVHIKTFMKIQGMLRESSVKTSWSKTTVSVHLTMWYFSDILIHFSE